MYFKYCTFLCLEKLCHFPNAPIEYSIEERKKVLKYFQTNITAPCGIRIETNWDIPPVAAAAAYNLTFCTFAPRKPCFFLYVRHRRLFWFRAFENHVTKMQERIRFQKYNRLRWRYDNPYIPPMPM